MTLTGYARQECAYWECANGCKLRYDMPCNYFRDSVMPGDKTGEARKRYAELEREHRGLGVDTGKPRLGAARRLAGHCREG